MWCLAKYCSGSKCGKHGAFEKRLTPPPAGGKFHNFMVWVYCGAAKCSSGRRQCKATVLSCNSNTNLTGFRPPAVVNAKRPLYRVTQTQIGPESGVLAGVNTKRPVYRVTQTQIGRVTASWPSSIQNEQCAVGTIFGLRL